MKPIKHIAIIAWGSLGDIAMIVPIVRALRSAKPDVAISVIIRPENKALLAGIEDITIINHKNVLSAWWTILRTAVDAVCDLNPVGKSRMLTFLTRIVAIRTSRLVIDKRHLEQLSRRTRKRFEPIAPVSERATDVIARAGIKFDLPISLPRLNRAIPAPVIRMAGKKTGTWVGVAPFARYKGKIYPIPQMTELLELMAKKYERVFILGGGDVVRLFGEGMQERIEGVYSVVGRLTLAQELALLANLDAVLTMDSASMHLAIISGAPVVSIWGATHPYEGFYGYGLRSEWAVQRNLTCRPCSKYGRKPCIWGDYRCLTRIKPSEIIIDIERAIADSQRTIIRRRKKKEE